MSRLMHQYECGCTLCLGDDRKPFVGLCPDHGDAYGHESTIACDENFPLLGWASKCPAVIVTINYDWQRVPSAIAIRGEAHLEGTVTYQRGVRLPLDARIEDARGAIEELFNEARFALEGKRA